MKKITYFLLIIPFFCGCNKEQSDPTQEDYQALFPWKGIEKPENSYEDMNIRQCDPDLALSNYRYMGVKLTDEREYLVTLKCSFVEAHSFLSSDSRYEIRYIDENKQLKVIGTNPVATHLSHLLQTDQEYSLSFRVKSGYPLYLSVNGSGNRSSNVKAQIKAVSTDGVVVVPTLSYQAYQNEEGLVKLTDPYCEYIILP